MAREIYKAHTFEINMYCMMMMIIFSSKLHIPSGLCTTIVAMSKYFIFLGSYSLLDKSLYLFKGGV